MGRSFSSGRLWLLVGIGAAALLAPAAARADDAVETLKRTLKEKRWAEVAKDAQKLKTLADLRRAYFLKEWQFARGVAEKTRDGIGARLDQGIRAGASGDVDRQVAACILIAEIAETDQPDQRGPTGKFAARFSSLLVGTNKEKGLVHHEDVRVQQAALHALGRITPPPADAMPVLRAVLKGDDLGPRRLAAYALTDLVKNAGFLPHSDEMATINQATAEAVRVLGDPGQDEQVRGYCLQTILTSARIFTDYRWTTKYELPLKERDVVQFELDKKLNKLVLDPGVQDLLKSCREAMPQFTAALGNDPSANIKLTALETISQLITSRYKLCEKLQVEHGKMRILPDELFGGKGIRIGGVPKDGAAQQAIVKAGDVSAEPPGLRVGDVIVELAGKQFPDLADYASKLAAYEGPAPIEMRILRDGKEFDVVARVLSRSELLKEFNAPDPIEPLLNGAWIAIPSVLKPTEDVRLKRGAMGLMERVAEDVEATLDTKKQEKKITADTLRRFVQAITPALSDPDRYVRWTAARTLRYLSPEYFDDDVILALGRMLIDPVQRDPDLSKAAAETIELIAMAPYAPKAILFLRSAIADPTMEGSNRIAAMKALVAIGMNEANQAAVNEAFPEVTSAVGADEASVRREACLTLGQLGHPATDEHYRAAINALKNAMRDDDTEVRLNASEAILSVAPPPLPR